MKRRIALLMLAPAMAFFLFDFLAPLVLVGRLSVYESDYVKWAYVGIKNYLAAFADKVFWRSFLNAGFYILSVGGVITFFCYFAASVICEMGKRMQAVMIFAFYAPTVAGGLIMAMIMTTLFKRGGLVNWLLGVAGLPAIPWFTVGWAARTAVSFAMVVSLFGAFVLMYAANMIGISRDFTEQAMVDGASPRQIRWHIILPQMIPCILLVSLLMVLGMAQIWEVIYWMTYGGPNNETATPVFDSYITMLDGRNGLAAAKSVIIMAVIVTVSLIKRRVEKWAQHEKSS